MSAIKEINYLDALGWKAHATVEKWQPKTMQQIIGDLNLPTHPVTGAILPEYEPTYEELMALTGGPDLVTESEGNLLVNGGIALLFQTLCNIQTNGTSAFTNTGANAPYTNGNCRIGVGSGSVTDTSNATVTAAATDTGLTADGAVTNPQDNRYYMTMNSTYPNGGSTPFTTWSWQATYATGNGNFVWQEWGIDNGVTAGTTVGTRTLLNHKGVNLGTKTSAASWTFTATIQIS